MQLIKLLDGLSKSELNKLQKSLESSDSTHQLLLLKELKKCSQGKLEYDRNRVFQKVFSEAFKPEKLGVS